MKTINPNPLDLIVARSIITITSSRTPYRSKYSLNTLLSTVAAKPPTNIFRLSERVLLGLGNAPDTPGPIVRGGLDEEEEEEVFVFEEDGALVDEEKEEEEEEEAWFPDADEDGTEAVVEPDPEVELVAG